MPRTGRVLVVDDGVSARTTLADMLRDEGYEVEMAADAFKALGKCDAFRPEAIVTDLQMPGMDGIELIKRVRAGGDPPAVLVMTAFGKVESAVEAMQAGATDYLTKPLDFERLLAVLDRVLRHREHKAPRPRAPNNLIGSSPAMAAILAQLDPIAASAANVLITGEPGTGKQLIASAIHQRSARARRPFVAIHCAGQSEAALDAELFGKRALGGTVFLDEVAALTPALQIKLLAWSDADARIIAATTTELRGFREDLYYKLRGVALAVPPLRERTGDLPALAKFFLTRLARAHDRQVAELAPDALALLAAYAWPGNVRELETVLNSAVILARGEVIQARDLPVEIRGAPRGMPVVPGATMAELERYAIVETMRATGGSTSKAAEILGISTRTVQYRLHQYHEAQRSELDVVRKPDK